MLSCSEFEGKRAFGTPIWTMEFKWLLIGSESIVWCRLCNSAVIAACVEA